MLLVIFASYDASACKCRNITLDESFSNSKAVLLVEIKSLSFTENSDRNPNETSKQKVLEATFDIIESFKKSDEPIKILRRDSSCDLSLYPGQKYVVFVPKHHSVKHSISHCDGSFPYRSHMDYTTEKYNEIKKYIHNKSLN